MLDTLNRLQPRHRLAVLTNKPGRPTAEILKGLEIDSLFSDVIGGDSGHGRKPDPAGLLDMVRRASVTTRETLLLGDSPVDLETSRRAGTHICLARKDRLPVRRERLPRGRILHRRTRSAAGDHQTRLVMTIWRRAKKPLSPRSPQRTRSHKPRESDPVASGFSRKIFRLKAEATARFSSSLLERLLAQHRHERGP